MLPSVYEETARKAFNGTGYQNWKTRFYLTRGMLSEEYADLLVKEAAEEYDRNLKVTAKEVGVAIDTLKQHIYFDDKTFYYGFFENSDEYLSYVGGIRQLDGLNGKMKDRLKTLGLERNIHSCCGIEQYLDRYNIELPRHFMDYDLPEACDIRNYAIVPIHPKKDFLNWLDVKAYGIDNSIKSHVLINQEHNIHRLIDEFDKMCYCCIIPEEDDEYYQFFRNVQAQIDANKSSRCWKALPFCQAKFDKIYDHLKGLDATSDEYREPIIDDEPTRYIATSQQFDGLMECVASVILGKEYAKERASIYFRMKVRPIAGSPIINGLSIMFRCANHAKLDKEIRDRVVKWLDEMGFVTFGQSKFLLMPDKTESFMDYLLETIPESREYIKKV